jgi:3',5'-cyclic AMP phosphodiesterase CpdA
MHYSWMITGLFVSGLGLLAFLAPMLKQDHIGGRVAVLLIITAIIEFAHGFRRATKAGQRLAWVGGFITLAIGLLLLNAPYLTSTAVILLLAGWFALDALRHFVAYLGYSGETPNSKTYSMLAGLGNAAACLGLLIFRDFAVTWTLGIAGGLRILGTAWNIFTLPIFTPDDSSTTVVSDLNLPESEELQAIASDLADEELARASIDRAWIIGFILTLFAIHLGRMGLDRTALGILSPGVAVLGDIFLGLLIAFIVIMPLITLWQTLTQRPARRAWSWVMSQPAESRGWPRRWAMKLLRRRMRTSLRLRQARYSLTNASGRALQWGLPLAAIIAATVPVWGISWYFDTENWAAGVWNEWAANRCEVWREAMVQAVLEKEPGETFAIKPSGAESGKDFSFIIIGDTGEGDASQHVLRASLLREVQREEIKFVVISSDVIYPTGAMRHYEANFWLPFMGCTKPVYAIPGNHDWYDALEGFVATFYTPDAARTTMRARIDVDKRITSTTEAHIEHLIRQASQYGREYRVPTQLQKAPYFQFQTDTFALFCLDTGVMKQLDEVQMKWFRAALASARGKTKMALLGHPFYSGGSYMAEGKANFAALHQLLKEHDVAIVMAGDTHDLEYYKEPTTPSQITHHFVNGGGGAYLSFGTSLAWPSQPATTDWAYYPAKAQVMAKIEATTPRWKWPAWWWTKNTGGWPFNAEFLSAAFDVNVAPYYQSFVEISVEPSRQRIRLIPYGIHGRLKWSDFDRSNAVMPRGSTEETLVEWVVPFRPAASGGGK